MHKGETDRDRQRQTETDRDRQRQTDRQSNPLAHPPYPHAFQRLWNIKRSQDGNRKTSRQSEKPSLLVLILPSQRFHKTLTNSTRNLDKTFTQKRHATFIKPLENPHWICSAYHTFSHQMFYFAGMNLWFYFTPINTSTSPTNVNLLHPPISPSTSLTICRAYHMFPYKMIYFGGNNSVDLFHPHTHIYFPHRCWFTSPPKPIYFPHRRKHRFPTLMGLQKTTTEFIKPW